MFKIFSIKIKGEYFYFSWDFGTKDTNNRSYWHQILTLHLTEWYVLQAKHRGINHFAPKLNFIEIKYMYHCE